MSMGHRSTCVRFVMEGDCMSMINENRFVRFVMEVNCARPHCVRRRLPTGSTKDIAYVVCPFVPG